MVKPLGFIFDVDETLLDNEYDELNQGHHERLRISAVHQVARELNIPELMSVTQKENVDAYQNSPIHTFEASLWNLFCMKGVRVWPIDPNDELLKLITKKKDVLYQEILTTTIKPVKNADKFVKFADERVGNDKLAISSSAKRKDILSFLETVNLRKFFPDERIIAVEDVNHPKPHPESFDLAFKTLNLPESSRNYVVALEDSPRGIVSAKAAGLFTCAITTAYSRERHQSEAIVPNLIVDSFDELQQVILK